MLTNVSDDPLLYPKISVTELNSLLRCTKKHDYAYRQGLTLIDPPSYLSKGSFLHGLMEKFLKAHAEGQEDFNLDVASTQTQGEILKERGYTVLEPDRVEVTAVFRHWLEQVDMTNVNIPIVQASDGEYVPAVELEFMVDMGWTDMEGTPVLLHGFPDAITIDTKLSNGWVQEHKTAGRAWSIRQFQMAYQGKLYVEAWKRLTGNELIGVQYNFFYPKKSEIKQVYTPAKERELILEEVQQAIWLRDSGSLVRQPHWGCNDCWYQDICFAELVGMGSDHLRQTKYKVDPNKTARFAEGDT